MSRNGRGESSCIREAIRRGGRPPVRRTSGQQRWQKIAISAIILIIVAASLFVYRTWFVG